MTEVSALFSLEDDWIFLALWYFCSKRCTLSSASIIILLLRLAPPTEYASRSGKLSFTFLIPFLRSKLGMKWIELSVSLLNSTKLFEESDTNRTSPEGISILRSVEGNNEEMPFRSGFGFEFSCSLLRRGEGDKFYKAYLSFYWTIQPGESECIFLGLTPTNFLTSLVASF